MCVCVCVCVCVCACRQLSQRAWANQHFHPNCCPGAGRSKGELKALSADLTKLRTLILSGMKKGEITLPFQPEENSISDASKDTDSPFFQFVQGLFAASSTAS